AAVSGPEGQTEIAGLINLAQKIRPLFSGRDNEIVIQGASPGKLSLNGLGIVQTIDVAARLVFESYSSLPGRDGAVLADVEALVEDFQQLSIDRGTLDPTVPHYARRRFREASSYGPVSDGDAKVDLVELTHYAAYVYSIEALAIRLRGLVEERCKVSDELDTMKWKRMDARCFRQVYFGNVDTLWDHFPRLQAHYRSLDAEGRAKLERMVEHAARHKGHNDEPVGGYEAQSFSAVVHFEEAYFERFDVNRDNKIQTEEALVAARNHRRNIAEAGNIDPTKHGILDAIYVFGVKHGRRPVRRGLGLVEFLAWLARRPFWNLNATSAEIFRASPLANTVPASEPPGRTE
ncbi:MAG TPA: hypothetical protein VM598_00385, partial [Bdellovibrionota bacterium]|nr:hypothetical protein [Bdellovibrionota bacterium]